MCSGLAGWLARGINSAAKYHPFGGPSLWTIWDGGLLFGLSLSIIHAISLPTLPESSSPVELQFTPID